jgi:uncharacterized protein YjbJ (UPF0337 family)
LRGGIEADVNWNEVALHWNDARPDIKSRWTKLTDDDLRTLDAKEDRLVSKIEERYGILEEDALVQIKEWLEARSPRAEEASYWSTIVAALAIGVVLAAFIFVPLPWGPMKYVVVGFMVLVLMAILFRRRRRLEF